MFAIKYRSKTSILCLSEIKSDSDPRRCESHRINNEIWTNKSCLQNRALSLTNHKKTQIYGNVSSDAHPYCFIKGHF